MCTNRSSSMEVQLCNTSYPKKGSEPKLQDLQVPNIRTTNGPKVDSWIVGGFRGLATQNIV